MIAIFTLARAMKDIKVEEVMSKNPVIASGDMPVREGAKLMKERGVSTLLIKEDDNIIGIVTDRDLVTKVLAEGADYNATKLRDIMSSPVVMIPKNESLSSAAKIMTRRRIRKLPVIDNGKIVGILSENDIARISPDLIALAREYAEMHNNKKVRTPREEYLVGKCELCGQYSLRLRNYNGMLVCPDCYDSLR